MPALRLAPLTPEQMLEHALSERSEIIARPQRTPRQVLGMWMENAGAGVGAGGVLAVALWFAGAPDGVLLSSFAGASIVVCGALMAWRGSADERALKYNAHLINKSQRLIVQQHKAQLATMDGRLEQALDELDNADEEIAQLRKSLDEMARQRDRAVYDLTREREQAGQRGNGRNTFVAPVELAPEDVRDATALITHYYEAGEHLSRRKAVENRRWSERQWDTAKKHLDAAGVIRIVRGQTEYPDTLDEALSTFGEYMLHSLQLSVPTVNKTLGRNHYVESDEG